VATSTQHGNQYWYQQENRAGAMSPNIWKYFKPFAHFDLPHLPEILLQPNLGKRNPMDKSDKPLVAQKYLENAFDVEFFISPHFISFSGSPEWLTALQTSLATVCNYRVVGDIAGFTGFSLNPPTVQNATDIDITDGLFVPFGTSAVWGCLFTEKSGSGPYTYTYRANVGSATISHIRRSVTFTPTTGDLGRYISFVKRIGIPDGAGVTAFRADRCVVSKVSTIIIEPNKPVNITCSYHASKYFDLYAGSYQDENVSPTDATSGKKRHIARTALSIFSLQEVTSNKYAYGNTFVNGFSAALHLQKIEIDLGIENIPVISYGDSVDTIGFGGIQGYQTNYNQATVTVELLYNKAYISDFSGNTGKNYNVYYTSMETYNNGWMAFCAPRCYQIEKPEIIGDSGKYYLIRVKLGCDTPGWTSTNEGKPWYLCIGGQ